jgi:protein disulfide-isomerase
VDNDISKGYWLVEHFSPYCHHCEAFAPTWQTLYEFYYTSSPVPGSEQDTTTLNSFTNYYDFHFGRLNCAAFGTACRDHNVLQYPSIILYKDGVEIDKEVGSHDIVWWSKYIEERLEKIKPGSRPVDGVVLPEVGAHEVDIDAEKPSATEKETESTGKSKSTTKTTSKEKTKTKKTPNPSGSSVALTAESFQKLVTRTRDPWFIKFYAPWCHHCQAMAPSWAGMAREMKGKLNIGEVNCDAEKRLCKDAKVKAFPTIQFYQGGERAEYSGLRGLGDLISFAKKAHEMDAGIVDIDFDTFKELEEKEEVIFLYFYDHATTSEDFAALGRLPLHLIGHAKIFKTNDEELVKRFKITTWPRLLVSRQTRPTYYPALAPQEMRNNKQVLRWMKSVWLPLVPELSVQNAHDIMENNFVVLGVLNRQRSDEFIIAKREIKEAALEWMERQEQAFQLERKELRDAKDLRIEEAEDRNDQRALRNAKSIRIDMNEIERKQVKFAWVDGVFWERWLRTTYGIDTRDGERVIISDDSNRRYWDSTFTGNPIVPSRTSILETLPKIVCNPPKLVPKSTISRFEKFFFVIGQVVSGHKWITAGVCSAVLLVGYMYGRGRMRRGKGFGMDTSFFHLDGKERLLGGVNSNGKVD